MKTTWTSHLMAGVLSLTCCGFLSGNFVLAQEPASQKAAREILTIDLAEMTEPWIGDLDGMVEWAPNFNHRACTRAWSRGATTSSK